MSFDPGHIELEWVVDSIRVGRRHRTELGDIDELASVIERDGLLQPITITPDGVLVCGARRLAAIKRLGWKKVNVWVRSGLSDRLGQLLAEQDDNRFHKSLTKREAAALYREVKQVMAEDAARHEAATRFSSEHQPRWNGVADLTTPLDAPVGDTREQASRLVTGRASYTTLEKIGHLERLAADPAQPETVRAEALAGLERIEAGAAVHPIYETIRHSATGTHPDREAELHALADEAVARATATKKKRTGPRPVPSADRTPTQYPVRAFVQTWGELADWWTHYDPDHLAVELTDEQTTGFLDTAEGTSRFAVRLREARNLHTGNGNSTVELSATQDESVEAVEPAPGTTARPHLRAL
ncbi:MAG: ParB N-terminal domain-containing protein [Brachybacterium sp.]|uniref:ParB N-terminal domain-containing protein n=1 Tax=Brachybacterium sp. TaxID=1891286 RepID=UPI003F90217F